MRREENNLQQSVLQECESMRRAESSSIFEFMKSHRMLLSTVSRETGARRGGGRGSWEDRGREAVKRARGEERKGCMGRHLTSSSLLSSSSAVARLRWLDPLALLGGDFGRAAAAMLPPQWNKRKSSWPQLHPRYQTRGKGSQWRREHITLPQRRAAWIAAGWTWTLEDYQLTMHMVPRCHMAYSSRFVFCIIPMSSSSWPDAGRCRIGGLIQAGAGRGAGRLELGGRAGRLGRPSGEDRWQPPEGWQGGTGPDDEQAEAQGAASESTPQPRQLDECRG